MTVIPACLILMMEPELKRQLKIFVAGDKVFYYGLMEYYSFAFGVFSLIFCIVIIQPMIKTLNWGRVAIIAPLFSFICGAVFFGSLWCQASVECSLETIKVVTYCCMGSLIMMKSFIYSLFFITIQLAFLTLSHAQKTIGKTIIDTYSKNVALIIPTLISIATLGKSELNLQTLKIEICVFMVMIMLWLLAVKALSKRLETQDNV
jgi:ATP/ADP translocase